MTGRTLWNGFFSSGTIIFSYIMLFFVTKFGKLGTRNCCSPASRLWIVWSHNSPQHSLNCPLSWAGQKCSPIERKWVFIRYEYSLCHCWCLFCKRFGRDRSGSLLQPQFSQKHSHFLLPLWISRRSRNASYWTGNLPVQTSRIDIVSCPHRFFTFKFVFQRPISKPELEA